MPIHTERMVLLPGSRPILEAELEGRLVLAEALGVEVPEGWPPPLYDDDAVRWALERLASDVGFATWGFRYFVLAGPDGRVAVGAGGYKGSPAPDGTVEIGYSVLPAYQRRGLASEAVRGMVGRAFAAPEVTRVIAETLPGLEPSIGVLEKTGFEPVDGASAPDVLRFELRRPGNGARETKASGD